MIMQITSSLTRAARNQGRHETSDNILLCCLWGRLSTSSTSCPLPTSSSLFSTIVCFILDAFQYLWNINAFLFPLHASSASRSKAQILFPLWTCRLSLWSSCLTLYLCMSRPPGADWTSSLPSSREIKCLARRKPFRGTVGRFHRSHSEIPLPTLARISRDRISRTPFHRVPQRCGRLPVGRGF
jgi:hypothetical protein